MLGSQVSSKSQIIEALSPTTTTMKPMSRSTSFLLYQKKKLWKRLTKYPSVSNISTTVNLPQITDDVIVEKKHTPTCKFVFEVSEFLHKFSHCNNIVVSIADHDEYVSFNFGTQSVHLRFKNASRVLVDVKIS